MLTLGSRGSPLALAQAELVLAALRVAFPQVEVGLRVIRSEGDAHPDVAFQDMSGQGWFTSRLEQAVLAGEVAGAVHSAKDLPTAVPPGLVAGAYLVRDDPRDVVVSRNSAPLLELAPGATIGTSSPRRMVQLSALRPDLDIRPLRGNLDTRLSQLRPGGLDAVVVAAAGMNRLRRPELRHPLDPILECTPAPAQGAIAVQAPVNGPLAPLLERLDDPDTRAAVEAERQLLLQLGGGCQLALGAFAEPTSGGWRLTAAFAPDGTSATLRRQSGTVAGSSELSQLANRLATQLAADLQDPG